MRKRNILHHGFMMSFLFIIISLRLFAEGEPIPLAKKVRVAFPYQPGFSETGTMGNYSGYTFDYLSKVAEYTGWDIEYITYDQLPTNEAIMAAMDAVESGDADIIGGIVENDSLKKEYDYCANSYGLVYTTLAALQNNPSVSEITFRFLSPLRVAVYGKATARNNEVEEYLQKEGVSFVLVPCDSAEEQMRALESGRADVASGVSLSTFMGTKTVASFAARPYYFAVTKGKKELLDELDEAIESISFAFPFFQSQLQSEYFGDTSGGFNLSTEQRDVLQEKKTINVLCVAHSAPFVMLDGKGKPQGVLVSLMDDFARDTGLSVEYDIYNERDILFTEQLATKKYDYILGIPVNFRYASNLGFIRSTPLDTVGMVVFHKPSLSKRLDQCTLALVDKSDRGEYFGAKSIIYGKTVEDCIRLVRDGKADIGYDNRSTVSYYDYDMYANLVMDPSIGTYADISVAVSNDGGNELLAILNNYIESVSDTRLANYYAAANVYNKKSSIELMARSNPIEAVLILSAFIITMSLLVFLEVNRRKEKRQYLLLEKANAAKSEFLSRMSHDIRTPMNGIMGLARMASESDDIGKVHDYLRQLSSSSTYLLGLLNDILTMSRIEEGKVNLASECVMTSSFIDGICPIIESQAKEKGVSFIVDDQSSPLVPYLFIDPLRTQQVIMNLLNNAVKFTKPGGTVRYGCAIATRGGKEYWRHTISDNGVGMTPEFMEIMYEPFTQKDHEGTNSGTGLGLSIVKKFVDLMGGTITATSEVGKGSTFIVDIPLRKGTEKEYHKFHTEAKEMDQALIGQLKDTHVLLCEDNKVNTMVALNLLGKVGCIIDTAENGKKGVEMFSSSTVGFYQFILMDIRMPVMDGLEASRTIRKMERKDASSVPIIAMSANAFAEDRDQSLAAGMNAHLAKPVDPVTLYRTMISFAMNSGHQFPMP